LADSQDIIVVTLNYRVPIFGFPGAPGLTQNVALLDQRMAIEWVRDNIAGFGGDPSSIVIDGQSSGAVAVDNWSYAFQEDPIVKGLISQSGNVFSFPLNTTELAADNWYAVSAQLGCGRSGDTVDCMRSKDVSAILAAVARVPAPPGNSIARSQPTFQGTIDNRTILGDYAARSSNSDFAHLPYLQGNNDHESGYYRIAALAKRNDPKESTWTEFELEDFTCPTAVQGHNRAKHGVPTWRFRYFGDWHNARLYPGSKAYHGSDMEMIIGNSYGVTGIPPSRDERRLTQYMQRAWAAFVRDPQAGLTKYGWPEYDSNEATLVCLGYNNSPSPSFVLPSVYDRPCAGLNLSFYNVDAL